MASKNKPKLKEFKGNHPYFEDGGSYSVRELSNWTLQFCPKGGVIPDTLKGRLYGKRYCEPKHLLSIEEYYAQSEEVKKLKGYCKEARLRVLNRPRLEDNAQKLSQKWLSATL